jgi:hypothetical protein
MMSGTLWCINPATRVKVLIAADPVTNTHSDRELDSFSEKKPRRKGVYTWIV